MEKGILYIVATPIGNLEDITLRALNVLKEVDLIACEDTRHTGMLLKHFEIKKPMVSYFQHSKLSKVEYIIEQLLNGKNIALVTDAGTPGISDPGQALIWKIRELSSIKKPVSSNSTTPIPLLAKEENPKNPLLIEEGQGVVDEIRIIPIPGASALIAAASISGMIEKEFYFAGFLPKKKGRQTEFKRISSLVVPIIIYESANRLERTLEDIKAYFGTGAEVFIAREITKMFEEYWNGSVEELLSTLSEHQLKGEIVLIVKQSK